MVTGGEDDEEACSCRIDNIVAANEGGIRGANASRRISDTESTQHVGGKKEAGDGINQDLGVPPVKLLMVH